MPSVAIVIINFNGEKDTVECLKSIQKLLTPNYKLLTIVVDNGSEKEFRINNSELRIKPIIIRSEENLGFTGGNNLGIRHALENGAEYVMLLNNDTYIDSRVVSELVLVLESKESVGITAPKIYFAPGFEYHKERYSKDERGKVFWYSGGIMDWENVIGHHRGVNEVDQGQYNTISETDFASGCCMMIKRSVLKKTGLLDDRYFLYYEESDLCERVKRAGYKILYVPKAVVWHKNAQSAGGSGSALQDYYITRNRLLFGMTYAPARTKFALLREGVRLFFSGRAWQKKGARDYFLKRFGKGSFKVER